MVKSLLDTAIPKNIPAPTIKPMKYKPKRPPKANLYKKVEVFDPIKKVIKRPSTSYLNDIINLRFHRIKKTSFIKGRTDLFEIEGSDNTPEMYLNEVHSTVIQCLNENKNRKVRFILNVTFYKEDRTIESYFHSNTVKNEESSNSKTIFKDATKKMLESYQTFQNNGSGWRYQNIDSLQISFTNYKISRGGSSYIPLPKEIANKKAIVNIQNYDHECFKWAVARALNPKDVHPERIDKQLKERAKFLNFEGISFPVNDRGIDRFEKLNNIGINVVGYENKTSYVYRSTKLYQNPINLFLFSNDSGKRHYAWLKNPSRLFNTGQEKNKQYFCFNCLSWFYKEEKLEEHQRYCYKNECVRIALPEKDTFIEFKNHQRFMKHPFVIYADFESFIKPIHTCKPNPEASYTEKYQQHEPSGFCYYIKSDYFNHTPVVYSKQSENENVAKIFVEKLNEEITTIYHEFKFPKKIEKIDEEAFRNTTHCYVCEKPLGKDRVREHDHYNGKFRGAACTQCNSRLRKPKFIPVFFHNLTGYDCHLFIKHLGDKLTCIPNNDEKYISFSKQVHVDTFKNQEGKSCKVYRELRFLDSFRFMASSLDTLSRNLSDYPIVKKFIQPYELAVKKGVYPYEHVKDLNVLNETQLPSKDKFYSELNDSDITDEEYEHAKNIWKTFKCKTMRDYHNFYCKTDVLLLADVFENFRNICLKHYKLDPAWYYTAPGLAWDAALKTSNVKLELLHEQEMIDMIEDGIRGGVSMISHRYSKANHPSLENYDSQQPHKYISYLDANNLYGWAMSHPLPTHGFKMMTKDELENWKEHPCILMVDLEYPKELHKLHNDYPLAPEKIIVDKVEKLITTLNDKEKYVVHYRNLKLYESLGLKIKKVHKGITFEESPWLKSYIDLNTRLRTEAKNDFEKDFFKLMNNSVFGKTMENIRNRVDVKLVGSPEVLVKLATKSNFERVVAFSDKLAAVHMKKTKLTFNKPIYLGFSILDISKTLMYDFHYNTVKKNYDATLLFTDTDSLMYEIRTDNVYTDIYKKHIDILDTSNFSKDHPLFSNTNKKVLGKFKDEAGGEDIVEFVGLRAKLYAYKMKDDVEEKKCKGVKKNVIKNNIKFQDYKECLFSQREQYRKMNVIRSYKHTLYTERVNKIALSANDDKRIVLDDKISTHAIGYL